MANNKPQPQSVEELLGIPIATPSQAQSVEDLLGTEMAQRAENVRLGLTPGGLTGEEQASGREFFTSTLPRAGVATLGGLAGGGPITSAAGSALADLLFQGIREFSGGRETKPIESLGVGL